jgi:ubiquinone/menaquinone biosynthesis C-methylase UbiE
MKLTSIYSRLGLFFDERAALFLNKPTITRRDLCYIAGRDYRVWTDDIYNDLIDSFTSTLALSPQVTLLEVGCAAGFLSQGLSPQVHQYYGVDLSPVCLTIARRLRLSNATFKSADGAALPWNDNFFDRVLCSDVFTNISDMNICRKIIVEMLRVTKPGGLALVASIFDAGTKEAYLQRVEETNKSLPPFIEDPDIAAQRWLPWYYKGLIKMRRTLDKGNVPAAVNYFHARQFYADLARELDVKIDILPIHSLNPYYGLRYNVLFQK